MFTTGALANGSQSLTATPTDAAGNVSPPSSALAVTVSAPINLCDQRQFCDRQLHRLDAGRELPSTTYGPEIFIDTNAEGGSTYAAGMGSVGLGRHLKPDHRDDGRADLYAELLAAERGAVPPNDFTAMWNGHFALALTNARIRLYGIYLTVTATAARRRWNFPHANGPSQWDLDNISLTANATSTTTDRPPRRSLAPAWKIPISR